MAFSDMYTLVRGSVPKLPLEAAKTFVKDAYKDIRRKSLWSFQLYDSNWTSPALINAGTATTVLGSDQVVLSAAAAAAVIASITASTPINQRQFRVGIQTICNINSFDGVNTLTIDRNYPDPSSTATAYNIYQLYYPAPYVDHLTFVSIRNMVMPTDLILEMTRSWLDEQDPQRTWWYFPTHCVYYRNGIDSANTATYKFPIFEVWGPPTSLQSYQLYGIRRGPSLDLPTDTLPEAITEEAVTALAKMYAYEWAEANKGAIPRNQGPDFKYLMGETKSRYNEVMKDLRRQDREIVDNFFFVRRSSLYGRYMAAYNTSAGVANPGNASW